MDNLFILSWPEKNIPVAMYIKARISNFNNNQIKAKKKKKQKTKNKTKQNKKHPRLRAGLSEIKTRMFNIFFLMLCFIILSKTKGSEYMIIKFL